jgi:hypothetical protein
LQSKRSSSVISGARNYGCCFSPIIFAKAAISRTKFHVGIDRAEGAEARLGSAVLGLASHLAEASGEHCHGEEVAAWCKFGENWAPLKAGLFDGALDRLNTVKAGFDSEAREVRKTFY